MLKKCAHAQQQDAERKTRNAVQPLRRGGMRLVAAVRVRIRRRPPGKSSTAAPTPSADRKEERPGGCRAPLRRIKRRKLQKRQKNPDKKRVSEKRPAPARNSQGQKSGQGICSRRSAKRQRARPADLRAPAGRKKRPDRPAALRRCRPPAYMQSGGRSARQPESKQITAEEKKWNGPQSRLVHEKICCSLSASPRFIVCGGRDA